MDRFSLNRFGQTLRWVLSVSRRKLVMWSAGIAVGVFLVELAAFALGDQNNSRQVVSSVMGISSSFILIAMLIGFSSVTSGLNGKRERSAFLMLPATNLEKFLALVIFATVVWTLCIVAAYIVGDLTRVGVQTVLTGEAWPSAVPRVYENMMPRRITTFMGLFSMLGFFGTFHSAYILGGTLLRKHAFVVTSLIIVLITATCIYLLDQLAGPQFRLISVVNGIRYVSPWYYVIYGACWMVTVFCYWAAYHIFKHIELISNKWTNYDILKR